MEPMPYRDLAARCRDACAGDRGLEGEIFRTFNAGSSSDDRWSDRFEDQVWHRECSGERGAWEGPPPYLGSVDAALASRLEGMKLTALGERERPDATGRDWRPCRAEITIATTPERMGAVIPGEGFTLAGAIMSAVLMAHDHVHRVDRD